MTVDSEIEPPESTAADDERQACVADIHDHMAIHGSKGWAPVMAKYPSIKERVFWRLVAEVKAGKPQTEVLQGSVKRAMIAARKEVPIPPDYIAKVGTVVARGTINFIERFERLIHDTDLLRAFSITKNDAGEEKIKNPVFFSTAAKLQKELLEAFAKIQKEMFSIERQTKLWKIVIDAIHEESPEVAERIMARVRAVNDEYGMTASARPGL